MASAIQADQQAPLKSEQKVTIVLHWLEKFRAQKILCLLEELNVKYELKTYDRGFDMLAPAEMRKIHPLGKSPVISVQAEGMAEPLVIAESGLIVEYLIEHFGPQLQPKKCPEGKEGQIGMENESWMRDRYFTHYAEGSLMPFLVMALLVRNIRNGSPFFVKAITNAIARRIEAGFLTPNFQRSFEFLENQKKTAPDNGEYLCGNQLTGADFMMSFPLTLSKHRAGFTKEKHPNLWAYQERLESRDAYKRAIQKIIEVEGSYSGSL